MGSTINDEQFAGSTSPKWDDLFFQVDSAASASGEVAQKTYAKYVSGVNAITKSFDADAGIVISASHNPAEHNGIKIFDKDGFKLSDDIEKEIVCVCGDYLG